MVVVGCWNKAALCRANLSHKCQLAVHYAIVTEMNTFSACRMQPHCRILDTHTSLSPWGALVRSHTHTHAHRHRRATHRGAPTARLNVARSQRRRRGVIRGCGRLLLPSSPPSGNSRGIDSQAYGSDLVYCSLSERNLFGMCCS